MDKRPVLIADMEIQGWNKHGQALPGQNGRRKLGLDVDLGRIHPDAWVRHDHDPQSHWQLEAKSWEKTDAGREGIVIENGKLMTGKAVFRCIVFISRVQCY